MTAEDYRWRGDAEGGRDKIWLDGPSNLRLGIALGDSARLVGLDVPAGMRPEVLGAVLHKLVDDADWVNAKLDGRSPDHLPNTTPLVQILVALDDEEHADQGLLRPEVLALDRALLLHDLGFDTEARQIVKRLPTVAVEVVELLHDARTAPITAPQLLRLISLVGEGDHGPEYLDALGRDVTDVDAPRWGAMGVEIPLHDTVTLALPPPFLAKERMDETSGELLDRVSLTVRRIVRLVNAASCIPDVDLGELAGRLLDALPRETGDDRRTAEAVVVDVLAACATPERGGPPMLAELVAALLLDRHDVDGALVQAVAHDGQVSTRSSTALATSVGTAGR